MTGVKRDRRRLLQAAVASGVGAGLAAVASPARAEQGRQPLDAKVAQAMRLAVEYDPDPPFDTGTPEKASPELRRLALRLIADSAR
ncbi:hypothetical protein ACIOHE_08845 [Streptomyces sp. NPDC087851]|uniref:hypothetical protein n=1 Tax=Streptomyces sp. NPDC087851 TaxID=3365810 RepID=UPI00382E64F5